MKHATVFSINDHSVDWRDAPKKAPKPCVVALKCIGQPTTGTARFDRTDSKGPAPDAVPCCIRCAIEKVTREAALPWEATLHIARITLTNDASATSTPAPAAVASVSPPAARAVTARVPSARAHSEKPNLPISRNSKSATNAKAVAGTRSARTSTRG